MQEQSEGRSSENLHTKCKKDQRILDLNGYFDRRKRYVFLLVSQTYEFYAVAM